MTTNTDPSNPAADPTAAMPSTTARISGSVGPVDGLAVGEMKAATVDGHRVVVVRSTDGYHVLDNPCPHQGYGLATGAFDGELITCQWHNWKFRAADGVCVLGEEDVACHRTEVVDGEVVVTIVQPTVSEQVARLWPSLDSAVDRHYTGQIARDTARLLSLGVSPAAIVGRSLDRTVRRTEDGVDHETAMAADALAMATERQGLDATLPVAQALAGMAEVTRDRPARSVARAQPPTEVSATAMAEAIETERTDDAIAIVLTALDEGRSAADLAPWFVAAVSMHHLSYGHGAIYTQKVFELIERIDAAHHRVLLAELVRSVVNSTREDLLPYMSRNDRAMSEIDVTDLSGKEIEASWAGFDGLVTVMLDAPEPPATAVAEALADGAGVERVLDAVMVAGARRLLRHRLDLDYDPAVDFGWLDITHVLTYAHAVRWAHRRSPRQMSRADTTRLAFYAAWLAHDSGRAERRHGAGPETYPAAKVWTDPADLVDAVVGRCPEQAMALALGNDPIEVGRRLEEASLVDGAGSFIVQAHLIKTARCVSVEAAELDSALPLAAAARFMAAPRTERFVARRVAEAVDFVATGRPPKR